MNKSTPAAEIGVAAEVVGIVVVGAGDNVEFLGFRGRGIEAPAHGHGDDFVVLAVNDQDRHGEAGNQAEVVVGGPWGCHLTKERGIEAHHVPGTGEGRFEDEGAGGIFDGQIQGQGGAQGAAEEDEVGGLHLQFGGDAMIGRGGVEKGAGPGDFAFGEAVFPVIEDEDLDLDQAPQ